MLIDTVNVVYRHSFVIDLDAHDGDALRVEREEIEAGGDLEQLDEPISDAAAASAIQAGVVREGDESPETLARIFLWQARTAGFAEAVLTVLDQRGIEIDDDRRMLIGSTRDRAVLDLWMGRAITATAAGELFD